MLSVEVEARSFECRFHPCASRTPAPQGHVQRGSIGVLYGYALYRVWSRYTTPSFADPSLASSDKKDLKKSYVGSILGNEVRGRKP